MNNEEKILEMLAAMQSEIGAVRSEIGAVRSEMETRFAQLETTQAQQGGQLVKLSTDVTELKGTVKDLDARSLKSAVLLETEVARDTHIALEGHSELKRKMDTLATKEQVQELAEDVSIIKDTVKHHRVEINELKKAQ